MKYLILLTPMFIRRLIKYIKYRIKYKNTKIDSTCGINNNVELDNKVVLSKDCRINNNVSIGYMSHINHNTVVDSGRIGKFCSIGPFCHIGAGLHSMDHLSTSHYLQSEINSNFNFDSFYSPPTIGHDVWIGSHVTIMQEVKVGDGVIIGAGSVVTKSIPDYSIAVGNPAKVIKRRFDDMTIERLQKLEWWNTELDCLKELFLLKDKFKEGLK